MYFFKIFNVFELFFSVKAASYRSARMYNSKLLVFIFRLLDECGLQCVEYHAQRRRRGSSLRIISVCFTVYVLFKHDVSSRCQRRRHIFGNRYHAYILALANIKYRNKLTRLASP